MSSRVLRLLPALICLASPDVQAQTETGSIAGTVIAEDARPLAGATVEARDRAGATVTTMAGVDGAYAIEGLARGSYTITVTFDGFENGERMFVGVRPGEVTRLGFVLTPVIPPGQVTVRAVVNAASNLPGYLPGSAISPGSMIVGFAQDAGPPELVRATELPLPEELAGFGGSIEIEGQRFPIYPVFTVDTQFGAVVDKDTPPGEGLLVIGYNGLESPAFRVRVAPTQPGFFTVNQNGQGRGIFTKSDFSLITPRSPAKAGDVVIAWGTDSSSFDNTPGVENRVTSSDVKLFLGTQELPPDDIFYYGPSAGFAGGLQAIFRVPDVTSEGCAVPFFADLEAGPTPPTDQVRREQGTGQRTLSNTPTLPRSDDGPCEDPHGLNDVAIDRVFLRMAVRTLRAQLTESTSFSGDSIRRFTTARVETQEVNFRSYQAPTALGTCAVSWLPQTFTGAFPFAVPMTGSFTWELPGVRFDLDENTTPLRYRFDGDALDPDTVVGGTYRWSTEDLTVGGVSFFGSGEGQYRRNAANAQQFVDPLVRAEYLEDGFVSVDDVLEAMSMPGSLTAGLIMQYNLTIENGVMGTHMVDCAVSGEADQLEQALEAMGGTVRNYARSLFPLAPERVTVTYRFRDVETMNMTLDDGGPVNATEQVIETESIYDIDPLDYDLQLQAYF